MKIAIIDDEPNLIMLAGYAISEYAEKNNITIDIDEFSNGEEFLNSFKANMYSIVFMDVYMPKLNGVDTAAKLRELDANVAIIFLTTSESHMKEALSCHAFDYLVKPATRKDYFKVLDDCIKHIGSSVLDNSKYIEFKSKSISIKLSTSKIQAAISNGHNVTIITNENISHNVKETFQTISDSLLECHNFLLINRGVIVNMDYIERIEDGSCILSDGNALTIKTRGTRAVVQAFEDYRQSIS